MAICFRRKGYDSLTFYVISIVQEGLDVKVAPPRNLVPLRRRGKQTKKWWTKDVTGPILPCRTKLQTPKRMILERPSLCKRLFRGVIPV